MPHCFLHVQDRDFARTAILTMTVGPRFCKRIPYSQNRGPDKIAVLTYNIMCGQIAVLRGSRLHNIVCKDRDFARTAILQTHMYSMNAFRCTVHSGACASCIPNAAAGGQPRTSMQHSRETRNEALEQRWVRRPDLGFAGLESAYKLS
eukprot:COSAG02_NODE_9038_length_2353_cov_1.792369_2_plen_148_part_00